MHLLDHLGHPDYAAKVMTAIEAVLKDGAVLSPNLGGTAHTWQVGDAVAGKLQ